MKLTVPLLPLWLVLPVVAGAGWLVAGASGVLLALGCSLLTSTAWAFAVGAGVAQQARDESR